MRPEVREAWMAARVKHGAFRGGVEEPTHYIWRSILSRCKNKTATGYKYYGGRGIQVDPRWQKYENFLADMGKRPSRHHSIDRVDNNANYGPGNCVWALRSAQQKNKTTTKWYTNGVFTGTLVECATHLKISKELAHWRFKTWGTFEKGKAWQLLPKPV